MGRLLMLCDVALKDGEVYESSVLCGLVTRTRKLEPAGRSFLEVHEEPCRRRGKKKPSDKDLDSSDEINDASFSAQEEKWRAKGKSNQRGRSGKGGSSAYSLAAGSNLKRILSYEQTLYEVLGVEEGATDDEIKKRYRQLVLKYHPDKSKEKSDATKTADGADEPVAGTDNSAHEAFLRIQEAFEALKDPDFRRQYDSSLPFDDSIPTLPQECSPETFFEVFGAAFARNSRWSVRRPTPPLGDAKTPIAAVEKFYEFWFEFESWRDFAVHDEYDLDTAGCREEKRWMERENAKIRRKYLKNERARIQKLVETSYAADPRIQEKKAQEKKKRDEERAAKQMAAEAARRQEDERRKKEEELARQRAEDERRELEKKQKERLRQKKWRYKFRWFHQQIPEASAAEVVRVQELSQQLSVDMLISFCDTIHKNLALDGPSQDSEGNPQDFEISLSDEQKDRVRTLYQNAWQDYEEAKRIKEAALQEELCRRKEMKQQQQMLLKKAKEATWTPDEMSSLAKCLQKFPAGVSNRWQRIAEVIGTKTEQEVVAKAKEMAQGASLKNTGPKISQVAFDQFKVQNQGVFKHIDAAPDKRLDSPGFGGVDSSEQQNVWTKEQQVAFEAALAKYPATLPPSERWNAIASAVPGKTRKECVERFKEIRAALLSKKGS